MNKSQLRILRYTVTAKELPHVFPISNGLHTDGRTVFALAVLKIGLTLSDQPAELAGILTGALLLAVLMVEAVARKLSARPGRISSANVKVTQT